MFESIHSEEDRGQVGIGTLIVFIAMVLVAAIAAGVLINTAGSLQSQASDTGTETQQAVANQIEVVHAFAESDEGGSGEFQEVNLIVKKSSGSDVIDLESATVQYTSDSASTTLAHTSVAGEDPEFSTYEASTLSDETPEAKTSLVDTGDRVAIQIDLSQNPPNNLETGDSVSIEIVDQSGAKFSYGVTVPQTVSSDQTVVNV
ncbi:archaellin/type IV pilin N-terminal domain-containing protein [Natrialbaceae archaeon A-CW3]